MTRRLRRALLLTGGIALALYASLVLAMFVMQRSLMYFPDHRFFQPDTPGVAIQVVRLATGDGERLVAWYLPPRDGKPIFLHLNGNGGGLYVQEGRWRRMADEGVGFLGIAWRGYGGSTGHPTEEGLIQDAEAGYAFLASRFPSDRIVIQGYSLGTGPAVQLAARHPARALILEAPYTSAMEVAERRYPLLPVSLLMEDRLMSRNWIGRVHMPVLIVHGERDHTIPFDMGQTLFRLANPPKRFVAMPESDHNTLVRDGLYLHVWRFLGLSDAPAAKIAVPAEPVAPRPRRL